MLTGAINGESAGQILHLALNLRPRSDLLLLINSEGGEVETCFGLVGTLSRHLADGLETRVIGSCASAAVCLLQAGARRTALPTATFFTHQLWSYLGDVTSQQTAAALEHFRILEAHVLSLLRRRTGRTRRFWADLLRTDRYFDAREAKRLGLIDRVL